MKSENADIWTTVKENLKLDQQPKSLQYYVRNNRHFVLSNLKQFFGIDEEPPKAEVMSPPRSHKRKREAKSDDAYAESSSSEDSDISSDESGDEYLNIGYLRLKIKKVQGSNNVDTSDSCNM